MSEDRITLRQSWLGDLAMCPERARQTMLGLVKSTESSNTMIGSAVHYGIEQCLTEVMETGDPLSAKDTVAQSMDYWKKNKKDIVRWNHKADTANDTKIYVVYWSKANQCSELRRLTVLII